MDKRFRALRLRQIDASLKPFVGLSKVGPPRAGWVRTVREALAMNATQLGQRMGISKQSVAELEERERTGSVTLEILDRAAKAMGATLVYAIVPRTSLEETVREQARLVAEQRVNRVAHSMALESQAVSREEREQQVKDTQKELLDHWSSRMWNR